MSSENFQPAPVFIPGAVYTKQYVVSVGISPKTLSRWEKAGLKPRKPGTKQVFYLSDDLIAILRLDPGEIPPYEE